MVEYLDMYGNKTDRLDIVKKTDIVKVEITNPFEGAEEYFKII